MAMKAALETKIEKLDDTDDFFVSVGVSALGVAAGAKRLTFAPKTPSWILFL